MKVIWILGRIKRWGHTEIDCHLKAAFWLEVFQKHSSCVNLWKVTLPVHSFGNTSAFEKPVLPELKLDFQGSLVYAKWMKVMQRRQKEYVKLKLAKSWRFGRKSSSLCWGVLAVTVWMEGLCTATVWSQKWPHYWHMHNVCAHTHTHTYDTLIFKWHQFSIYISVCWL